jgi:hypothetical protein
MRDGKLYEMVALYHNSLLRLPSGFWGKRKTLYDNSCLELATTILKRLEEHPSTNSSHNFDSAEKLSPDLLHKLREFSDSLSYSSYQLQMLAIRELAADEFAETEQSLLRLVLARVAHTEHLYRMLFTLTRACLDESQSIVYLNAARDQAGLASIDLETYGLRYGQLSERTQRRLATLSRLDCHLIELIAERKRRRFA